MTLGSAAIAMLAIAGYCCGRLVLGCRRGRSGTWPAEVAGLTMATAMAGMFVPALALPLSSAGWMVVFALFSAAYLIKLGRSVVAGSGSAVIAGLDHVVAGIAMLIMVAGGAGAMSTAIEGGPAPAGPAMASMHHGAQLSVTAAPGTSTAALGDTGNSPSGMVFTASLVLAGYLAMAAVRQAAAVAGSARSTLVEGPGSAGWFMAPIWMSVCEGVMAVAMVAMLLAL